MAVDRKLTSRRASLSRIRPAAEILERRQLLATIVINSAGDADGADQGATLSLRQAIEISNGTLAIGSLSAAQAALVSGPLGTPNTIDFAIPGAGPFTIMPTSALPAITSPAVIDGYSQPGSHPNTNGPGQGKNTVLRIELDGAQAGPGASGLDLRAGGNTVRGLAIGGFRGAGILVDGPGNDLIEGNFIGTDPNGTGPLPNSGDGIGLGSSIDPGQRYGKADTIGGTAAGAGNVISGNAGDGLSIGSLSLVEGNFIGTDRTGSKPVPNGGDGVVQQLQQYDPPNAAAVDTIGGTAAGAGNVISGNAGDGLTIGGSLSLVEGNFIGTDRTGTGPIPNGGDGIAASGDSNTIGGTAAGAGNVISGNAGNGLVIGSLGLVQGNFIGADLTGTRPVPNGGDGIGTSGNSDTIGGTTTGAGNVIAYNHGDGLLVLAAFRANYLPVISPFPGMLYFPPIFLGYLYTPSGQSDTIAGNSIFENKGLGIRLLDNYDSFVKVGDDTRYYNGISFPASAPKGANALLSAPAISSVTTDGAGSAISGTYSGAPATTFTLEFFDDPAGTGQGRTFLGTTGVTTDALGYASFRFAAGPGLAGHQITATATDPLGDTSEFSGNSDALTPTTTRFLTGSPLSTTTLDPVALDGIVALASGGVVTTGDVTLSEDGRPVSGGQGVSTLDAAGHFHFDPGPLSAGSHTFTVAYSGTTVLAPGTSAPLTVAVAKVITATTLLTGSRLSTTLDPVALDGIVALASGGVVTTGTVTLLENGLPVLGGQSTTGLDAAGHFHFDLAPLAAGSHAFTVAYGGTTALMASNSGPLTVEVVQVATTTTLATSPASPVSGQPFTLVATVDGPPGGVLPGGSVTFIDRSRVLGSAAIDAFGHASIIIPAPDEADTFAAVYDGSPAYAQSVSAFSAVTAARVSPAVVLVGPSNVSTFGQTLPFVAVVVPSRGVTPTGSVVFGEAGAVLAVVPLDASGRATFITSTLLPGPHLIEAAYLGDASDNIALSNFVAQVVLPSLAFGGPTVTSTTVLTSTSVKVAMSQPLLVGPAQDPANYAIIGPDGHALTIASAVYDPTDDSVTVTTLQPLKPGRSYRITVDGLRIGRVVDVAGIALDGAHNGRPGSSFDGTIRLPGHVAAGVHPSGPVRATPAQVHKKRR